jgi:hypothetical protein
MDQSLERDRDTPNVPARALEAMAHLMQYWQRFVGEVRESRLARGADAALSPVCRGRGTLRARAHEQRSRIRERAVLGAVASVTE